LIRGADRQKIIRFANEKWGIGEWQTDRYIHSATAWINRITEGNKTEELAKSLAQRLDLYFRAYENKELGLCHEIRKDLDKLGNLYPAEKMKHQIVADIKTESTADVNKVLDTQIEGTNKSLLEIVRDAYRSSDKK